MFGGYLTREVNMFPGREMADRKEPMKYLKEIGKLNVSEECIMESNASHWGLGSRIAISHKIANVKLTISKIETKDGGRKLTV